MLTSTCCTIFKCFWSWLCCFQAWVPYGRGHTCGRQPLCITNCRHTYTVWPWAARWTGTSRLSWFVDSSKSVHVHHQSRRGLNSLSCRNLNWLRTGGYNTCCRDNWWRQANKFYLFWISSEFLNVLWKMKHVPSTMGGGGKNEIRNVNHGRVGRAYLTPSVGNEYLTPPVFCNSFLKPEH